MVFVFIFILLESCEERQTSIHKHIIDFLNNKIADPPPIQWLYD